jgi:hypothetical protein
MATFGDTLPLYADDFGIPVGTTKRYGIVLRAAGCVSATKRGRGGVDITTLDAVRTTVALLTSPSDTQAAEVATRVCGLPMVHVSREGVWSEDLLTTGRDVFDWLRGLDIGPLDDLGEVLRTLIDAMRSGALDRWSGAEPTHVYVEFQNEGAGAAISILPRSTLQGAMMLFGTREDAPAPILTTAKRIDERFLSKLAATLGPLPKALPPPPY